MLGLEYFFLAPIVAVGLAAALHSHGYLSREPFSSRVRFHCFFWSTLAAMAGVVFAPGKLSFLIAWEAMGLASAGLVAFDTEEKAVRKATWIYLLACHAGACALMLAGVMLGDSSFVWAAFACAVIGFGLKVGFPPFHVWLPEAHPAAPAPASAVMSGAMIPLGIYGLSRFIFTMEFQRTVSRAGVYPVGLTILALGLVGALGGILFALPQTNLKKLLAFSSVENMGVVAIGFGFGLFGMEVDSVLGIAAVSGALAHVLNHATLKGALFLGAGSVLRGAGTLDQDRLGGLMKRMPITGALFTFNSLGLAGLPPLNGFLGELLIYFAAFRAVQSGAPVVMAAGFAILVVLSLTGGLAAVAYTKAIGAVFLGEPRSRGAAEARETQWTMWGAQAFLSALSIAMIPGTYGVVFFLSYICGVTDEVWNPIAGVLDVATLAGAVVILIAGLLIAVRRYLCPRGAVKPAVPTWDCGYREPTARMAYTATAFTQPIADFFRDLLRPRRHVIAFKGHPASPTDAAIATETDDIALAGFWRPVFTKTARLFQLGHLLQNGSLHFYILLILIAVVVMIAAALMTR